jgi:hypothetical protein
MGSELFAQTESDQNFTTAIEDNSMFIEEAYNQEYRVVQHISNLAFLPNIRDNFFYAFTQEWPAFGLKHQLSYTLQYNSFNKGSTTGIGDILINYRYQLSYKNKFLTCSPRVSVILPTGDKTKGMGNDSYGVQVNLPISKRWTNHFINHVNLGSTYFFKVRQKDLNFNKPLVSYFAGVSSIWLVTEKFNLMLESIINFTANPALNNKVNYTQETIIAPALRYAIDIHKLQIVPGISIPFTISEENKTETGVLIYLSFEHEF